MKKKEEPKNKVTIRCKTPKGKVKSTIKKFKTHFTTFTWLKKPKEKILDNETFELIFFDVTRKQEKKLIRKAAMAEISIKYFYRVLIKLGGRANKTGEKYKKSTAKIKKWFIKRYKKLYGDKDVKQFEDMPEEEFKELLEFDDKEEMLEFLEKDLIEIETGD